MAHRTHLYAAISSGTVTAQTFEQLPTAIIKKKKKKNLQPGEMSASVHLGFSPRAQRLALLSSGALC